MPFRPESLAYQLRALFDAGVAAPADVARSCGVERSRVDGWLRGRIPDRVTELQVRKFISYHARRKGDRHLKIEFEDAGPGPALSARGVYVEDIPAPGETWYKLVLSNGKVGTVHLPNELVDGGLYENLCRRLDKKDPVKTLKAV